jgi:hypothetical protein
MRTPSTPRTSSFRRATLTAALGCLAAVAVPITAAASEDHPGCNGLYEQARFRTYQQVGETHGHDTVHHVFERLGCGDHHD